MKKYSPSENAFYDTSINSVIPSDSIEISEREWVALLEGQTQGKLISCDANLKPCLIEPPPLTAEELLGRMEAKKNKLRAEADIAIQPLQDAAELGIASNDESNLLLAWKKYRVQLMRIDTAGGLGILWPDMPGQ